MCKLVQVVAMSVLIEKTLVLLLAEGHGSITNPTFKIGEYCLNLLEVFVTFIYLSFWFYATRDYCNSIINLLRFEYKTFNYTFITIKNRLCTVVT